MEALKKFKHQIIFHLIVNFAITAFVTLPSFVHYPLDGLKGYLFYTAHFLALQFSVFGFVYFISLNRFAFNFLFPILFTLFSVAGYWVYFHDIAISQGIIQISLETTPDIVVGLISWPLIAYLILSLALCLIILKLYNRW